MKHSVKISDKAEKYLKTIPEKDVLHIREEIYALEEMDNPKKNLKEVEGSDKKQMLYSIRIGKYRVILTFLKGKFVIVIIEIGLRKTIYRKYQS